QRDRQRPLPLDRLRLAQLLHRPVHRQDGDGRNRNAPHPRTAPGASRARSGAGDVTEFVALGHAGSEHYAGLETFPNPGVTRVEMTSDELTAVCPITGQPDFYVATIDYDPAALCLE